MAGLVESLESLDAALAAAGAGCRADVRQNFLDIIELRRHFHQNPELSFKEVRTGEYVANYLRGLGLPVERVTHTGVIATITGAFPGRTVALRADMDALPVQETTGLPFASKENMHACGHDAHIAILLGTAKVISAYRDRMHGSVRLVFQPAEEDTDEELGPSGGAAEMVKDGVLEGADEIYGLHVWNYDPLGVVGVQRGPIMAACDILDITVRGRGGHGAAPQGTVDALVVAAQLVLTLQTVVSRNLDPLEGAVLTLGRINGGYASNVIADTVSIQGTSRSFSPSAQALLRRRVEEICRGVGSAFGAEIEVRQLEVCPNVVNESEEHVELVRTAAKKVVGERNVRPPFATMASEDFGFFLQEKPGCFFFVGSAPAGEARPHHKPNFTIDEAALAVGTSVFVQLICDRLGIE